MIVPDLIAGGWAILRSVYGGRLYSASDSALYTATIIDRPSLERILQPVVCESSNVTVDLKTPSTCCLFSELQTLSSSPVPPPPEDELLLSVSEVSGEDDSDGSDDSEESEDGDSDGESEESAPPSAFAASSTLP